MVIIILSFSNILLSGQVAAWVAGGWIPIKVMYVQMVCACNSDTAFKKKLLKLILNIGKWLQIEDNARFSSV